MNVELIIALLVKVLSGTILVVSVYPLFMMPVRIVLAVRYEIRHKLAHGKYTGSPSWIWLCYGLVLTGVVFSLYQLDFVDCVHAIVLASIAWCLLACMFLVSLIVSGTCIRTAKGKGSSSRNIKP